MPIVAAAAACRAIVSAPRLAPPRPITQILPYDHKLDAASRGKASLAPATCYLIQPAP